MLTFRAKSSKSKMCYLWIWKQLPNFVIQVASILGKRAKHWGQDLGLWLQLVLWFGCPLQWVHCMCVVRSQMQCHFCYRNKKRGWDKMKETWDYRESGEREGKRKSCMAWRNRGPQWNKGLKMSWCSSNLGFPLIAWLKAVASDSVQGRRGHKSR